MDKIEKPEFKVGTTVRVKDNTADWIVAIPNGYLMTLREDQRRVRMKYEDGKLRISFGPEGAKPQIKPEYPYSWGHLSAQNTNVMPMKVAKIPMAVVSAVIDDDGMSLVGDAPEFFRNETGPIDEWRKMRMQMREERQAEREERKHEERQREREKRKREERQREREEGRQQPHTEPAEAEPVESDDEAAATPQVQPVSAVQEPVSTTQQAQPVSPTHEPVNYAGNGEWSDAEVKQLATLLRQCLAVRSDIHITIGENRDVTVKRLIKRIVAVDL